MERLRSDRIEEAFHLALETAEFDRLLDLFDRESGLPGPRPRTDVLKAFGARVASEGRSGRALFDTLLASDKESHFYVAVFTLAALASSPNGSNSLHELVELAEQVEKSRRDAVIEALAAVLAVRKDAGVEQAARGLEGYLHLHVLLEAVTHPRVLEKLASADTVLGPLTTAFDIADDAPRSAGRSQGLRLLRGGMPVQIARLVPRFEQTLDWLRERAARERPETREVVAAAIKAVRKIVGDAEASRLSAELERHAPAPRDPTRIVQGTRKRSRGR